jgi:hypothetical protein
MSLAGVWPQVRTFFGAPPVIEPSPGQLSGDAGLLPVRQLPAVAPPAETAAPAARQPGEGTSPAARAAVPAEALTGAARQRHFRQRHPLGEGHPCTWRTLLIKVAAEVVVRTRRIVVRLSSSWPHLDWYRRGCMRRPVATALDE